MMESAKPQGFWRDYLARSGADGSCADGTGQACPGSRRDLLCRLLCLHRRPELPGPGRGRHLSRALPAVVGLDGLPALSGAQWRSEEHTSELQSLMRISYAVFCLQKKKQQNTHIAITNYIRQRTR